MNDSNRLKRAREMAGLSVGQAARLLGWRPQALHDLEIVGVYDNEAARAKLAELYGVSVAWLLGYDRELPENTVAVIHRADLLPGERERIETLLVAIGPGGIVRGVVR